MSAQHAKKVPARTRTNTLKKYQEMRDFSATPEPKGRKKKGTAQPTFVIHKHDATRLHYDLRLEIDGVMPSWAIPKGPSLNPADKRLAVRTEDHPLEYATFEGVIPEGHYGAGPVMIWDYGTYTNSRKEQGKLVPMAHCLQEGRLEFELHGKKLHGAFALIRMNQAQGKEQWLLIKMRDDYATARKKPTVTQNKSAVSNKTMRQILKGDV